MMLILAKLDPSEIDLSGDRPMIPYSWVPLDRKLKGLLSVVQSRRPKTAWVSAESALWILGDGGKNFEALIFHAGSRVAKLSDLLKSRIEGAVRIELFGNWSQQERDDLKTFGVEMKDLM